MLPMPSTAPGKITTPSPTVTNFIDHHIEMDNDIVADAALRPNDREFINADVSAKVGGLYDGMRAYFAFEA